MPETVPNGQINTIFFLAKHVIKVQGARKKSKVSVKKLNGSWNDKFILCMVTWSGEIKIGKKYF